MPTWSRVWWGWKPAEGAIIGLGLSGAGHTVKLMAPQFVSPMKLNKNDASDAEAICEAVPRANMRFVPQKSIAQQDMQCLHRVRGRLVGVRPSYIPT